MPASEESPNQSEPSRRLSAADCRAIASRYNGTPACIEALLREYRARVPTLKRHDIPAAARRGGYKTQRTRKAWTEDENAFIRANWHLMSGDEVAASLGRSFNAVNVQRKRLEVGRYDGSELTIREVEEATRIDHRQWHDFVNRGWLKVRERGRRRGATPITYISIDAILKLLREHPDVYDYRNAPQRTRNLLELDSLPAPPKYKRLLCESSSWTDLVKPTPVGARVTHGAAQMVPTLHRFTMASCAEQGGTRFWTPLYDIPACPRCGCWVSRFSAEALFTDLEPDDSEVLDVLARKLNLRWVDGELRKPNGDEVKDSEVLRYVFGSERSPSRAVTVFQRLIAAGVKVNDCKAVDRSRLLDDILGIELRPSQEDALQEWLRTGSMTAAHAMSFGKSTLGLVALTRLPGRHLLMVDTALNREQWIERLSEKAPSVRIARKWKPYHVEVTVFDRSDAVRCAIEIFTYQARTAISGSFVLACFDEVHRLPASSAHRHALATCEFRLGLSSTAKYREDGRGEYVHKLTGPLVGDDWTQQMAEGCVRRLPVKVVIVEDVEHKNEVVGRLLRRHRVAVMCERLADGHELERRYGVPFIHSATKDKLGVIRSARSICLSRVGDSAISLPGCEVTVDHSGLFGSRSQSLQRLGRLMHSDSALCHIILMTPAERVRFDKRVAAIRDKGFEVTEEVDQRAPGAVRALSSGPLSRRVSAQDNPFISVLGWRKDELIAAA